MPNHPSEKDQVRMVTKNILPTYGRQLAPIPLKTFVDLYDVGIQVEDAINSEIIEKNDAEPQKKFGVGYSSNSGNNGGVIKPLDLGRYTLNTSAPNYNAIEYFKYHHSHGHSTDIEDLIQSGKVPLPLINLPNIKTNHLPDYYGVPPSNWG
ncbi:hypothetical protein SO802_017824 [Lithocarpus litseifolius]|uniref:Uncharacterized protein n=1 Tax=Lithocarpus litseifolius TaxID=425828 RepID=A0AAW2CJ16_9ROSI